MKPLDFDRAFPSTPDCIHAAIDMGFRKGQQQMKKRTKIISACSVAAAAVILIAVAAFAAGGISAPQPDLLAQPVVRPSAAPAIAEYIVYCTDNGLYYHSDAHCAGMQNAKAHSISDALALGKVPCPFCIIVYCTDNGLYYHSDAHCAGMRNAKPHSISDAQILGKDPCPRCMADAENGDPFRVQAFEAPNRLSELP